MKEERLKDVAKELLDNFENSLNSTAVAAARGMLWLDNIHESFNGFITGHEEVTTFLIHTDSTSNPELMGFRKRLRALLPKAEQKDYRL